MNVDEFLVGLDRLRRNPGNALASGYESVGNALAETFAPRSVMAGYGAEDPGFLKSGVIGAGRLADQFVQGVRQPFLDPQEAAIRRHRQWEEDRTYEGLQANQPVATWTGENLPMLGFPVGRGLKAVAGGALPGLLQYGTPEERLARGGMGASGALVGALLNRSFHPLDTYHGSPYRFKDPLEFDMTKIGSGTGGNMQGWGIYLAEHPSVGKWYRDQGGDGVYGMHASHPDKGELVGEQLLSEYYKPGRIVKGYAGWDEVISYKPAKYGEKYDPWHVVVKSVKDQYGRKPPEWDAQPRAHATYPDASKLKDVLSQEGWKVEKGYVYKVDLPDEHIPKMLDWDSPLKDLPEHQRGLLSWTPRASDPYIRERMTVGEAYNELAGVLGSKEKASKYLLQYGVPGIKYLDQNSRPAAPLSTLQARLARAKAILDDPEISAMERNVSKQKIEEVTKQIADFDKNKTWNFVVFDPSIAKILGRE